MAKPVFGGKYYCLKCHDFTTAATCPKCGADRFDVVTVYSDKVEECKHGDSERCNGCKHRSAEMVKGRVLDDLMEAETFLALLDEAAINPYCPMHAWESTHTLPNLFEVLESRIDAEDSDNVELLEKNRRFKRLADFVKSATKYVAKNPNWHRKNKANEAVARLATSYPEHAEWLHGAAYAIVVITK